ncbi:hypothetical protein BO71DRAFT_430076 [Aspergillus ellipticus CBS 707.79]|uniref:Uncharacterized protein n=1 Tax=Aspergillus ellipticus CBS 707.79 TaxID=1448320 RepID=A0A319ETE2_9EURO|nr:hypothetical protein BO71DRAFT_430076 [Aspergillus ellipticus CBS 707.79]
MSKRAGQPADLQVFTHVYGRIRIVIDYLCNYLAMNLVVPLPISDTYSIDPKFDGATVTPRRIE